MAGPGSLFDAPLAGRQPAAVEPNPPDEPPAKRLRVLLVVALLAVGLADLAVLRRAGPVRTAGPASAAGSTQPASPAAPPPVALPSLAPPSAPPTAGPSAQDAADVAVVQRYYALLPRRPGDAFRLLGATARAQSGGYPRFAAFYSGIAVVSIDPTPVVVAPSTVAAVIRFQRRTGEVTHERYELVVATGPAGRHVVQSYRRT